MICAYVICASIFVDYVTFGRGDADSVYLVTRVSTEGGGKVCCLRLLCSEAYNLANLYSELTGWMYTVLMAGLRNIVSSTSVVRYPECFEEEVRHAIMADTGLIPASEVSKSEIFPSAR